MIIEAEVCGFCHFWSGLRRRAVGFSGRSIVYVGFCRVVGIHRWSEAADTYAIDYRRDGEHQRGRILVPIIVGALVASSCDRVLHLKPSLYYHATSVPK
jgi:hypothetical protein